MARKVFYSFHYIPDNWRAATVRNIRALEGNQPVSDNDWERVTRGGEIAIKNWINRQLEGRSCCVVLIGSQTAGRKWINYEIKQAWDAGKGVVGVHIHNLKNAQGLQSTKGNNPLSYVNVPVRSPFGVISMKPLSGIAKAYDFNSSNSQSIYNAIVSNLEGLVDEAITIRKRY